MERYDYRQNVKDDVKTYIKENEIHWTEDDRDDVQNDVNEQCWVADSVTGNGSGSYTFNTWQAEENVCHNTDLLAEALEEWGQQGENILEKGAEWADVTIRCYLLGECIGTAMDELEEEGWNDDYQPEPEDDDEE
jgi:hypothetical protein